MDTQEKQRKHNIRCENSKRKQCTCKCEGKMHGISNKKENNKTKDDLNICEVCDLQINGNFLGGLFVDNGHNYHKYCFDNLKSSTTTTAPS